MQNDDRLNGTIRVRAETEADVEAIEGIVKQAFADHPYSQQNEHRIVAGLRAAGELALSLVAETDSGVVGHIAFSKLRMEHGSTDWYALGPLAVQPGSQGRGVGSQLVKYGLRKLKESQAHGCVVLGPLEFYSRFGFVPAPAMAAPGFPAAFLGGIAFDGELPDELAFYDEVFFS